MGVGEWRTETSADLEEASELIERTIRLIRGEPTDSALMNVWHAYMKIEKSIAFIRFEIDEENPGRFIRLKAFAVPDERQALQFAERSLKKGSDSFRLGDFRLALKDLRESRNYLRALLREKRLKRTREARRP